MISFLLSTPPSINRMFRNVAGVGRVKTGAYRDWAKEAMQDMMAQRAGQTVPRPPVAVTITVPDSKGRGDIDNRIKAVLDCLVNMGVLEDDSDKFVRRVTVQTGADKGRCLVTVEPMEAV